MSTSETTPHSLLRVRSFILLWLSRFIATTGYRMLTVMIGWQIYLLTNSAFDLGLIGLIQFVPAIALTLLIGHTADRYDRRVILACAQSVYALAGAAMLVATLAGVLSRELIFTLVFFLGCARAFEMPTAHALMPATVPMSLMSRAVASWTSANQVAIIIGPALGGLLYVLSPIVVSVSCLFCFVAAMICLSQVKVERPPPVREAPTFSSVLAGFHYVGKHRRLLGVITLDLFVVVFGGATALMPVFARDILEIGPVGLGLLNSAPAIGAVSMSIVMSNVPVERHIGPTLFAVVALYGVATVIFGLSSWLPLSLVALAVLGAADAVSVVIRFTLVQLETPDDMRGRVGAINYLCIGTSNTLGDFRAGAFAAWWGTVPSVLIGGIGSIAVAGLWMLLFPEIRRVDRYPHAEQRKQVP